MVYSKHSAFGGLEELVLVGDGFFQIVDSVPDVPGPGALGDPTFG